VTAPRLTRQCIALVRGINVGRAKRIPMSELRNLIEELGYSEVRTVLNSGNAAFRSARPDVAKIGATIGAAIESRFGFVVPVIVLTAQHLNDIVAENTLHKANADPSKFLVAFVADATALARAKPLLSQSWSADAMLLGSKAAYLWCANGISESKLLEAFFRAIGEGVTTRNWGTVLKLRAAVAAPPHSS
jgi:uncharacterized protein (DUF1697 family)